MTNHQWIHHVLVKAYGREIITAQQVAELLALYRGLK